MVGEFWNVCSAAAAVATVQRADSAVLFLAEMGPVKYTVDRVYRVYRVYSVLCTNTRCPHRCPHLSVLTSPVFNVGEWRVRCCLHN